ncbi:MAG: methyltransferase domain-containing protein [Acidobacteriota bacterium]
MAFSLFRKSRGPVDLAADMVGVRLGERLLHVGVGMPRAFALLAGRAGLTGRACAVVADAISAKTLEAAAAREGVFAEVFTCATSLWPLDNGSFDVAVVDATWLLQSRLASAVMPELWRCLRPGARAVALHRRPRGLALRLGFERRHDASREARLLEARLESQGFSPVRLLAEREGLTFVEGFRAR